jgi:glycosyltransferase involved in cell wall biosynthesis
MAGPLEGPAGQKVDLRHAERLDQLSHAETMALMSVADIVISPSLYEPFGLAALEGARAGAALVLADIATYRELWCDVALFADPRNPQSFADKIQLLSSDTDLREELGQRAQQRSSEYSMEAQVAALIDIYTGSATEVASMRRCSA